MGWGLDAHWSWLAREHGWRIGIVDLLADRAPRRAGRRRLLARARRSRRRARSSPSIPTSGRRVAADARRAPPMRVAVVAEFYPRRHDPVLGVWAHRQASPRAPPGAEVAVFVLHRLVPPRRRRARAGARCASRPRERRDGLDVRYVRYVSPPRGRSYARWGAWAAPALRRALRRAGPSTWSTPTTRSRPATPCCAPGRGAPLVVSVHGGDVLWTSSRVPGGRAAVERVLGAASAGARQQRRDRGARARPRRAATRVVHLGTDVPAAARGASRSRCRDRRPPGGAQAPRRRDARPSPRFPASLPGDRRRPGARCARGAGGRLGVADRVEFAGPARRRARPGAVARGLGFAMPSTEEAFGVAYIEAMAAGIPAIGAAGEPGPGRSPPRAGHRARRAAPPRRSRGAARPARGSGCAPRARCCRRGDRRARVQLGALRRPDARGLRRGAGVKPALFMTGHVSADRSGAFELLHERPDRARALRRSPSTAGAGRGAAGVPHRHVRSARSAR